MSDAAFEPHEHEPSFDEEADGELGELIALASPADEALSVGGADLFVDELILGPGHLSEPQERRIAERLIEVARVRKAPLHLAVAWNSVYFGFDPEQRRYDLAACGELDPPPVSAGERIEALPIGALVMFTSGTGRDEHMEWAEVVYKEGRPAAALLGGGLVKPEYSGAVGVARAGGAREQGTGLDEAALQEMLVLDFAPFGPLDARSASWLERARNDDGRSYIDAHGHVSVDAVYASAHEAELDDEEYFCHWMLEHHGNLLAHGWLGAALDNPDDQESLLEAMENSVRALSDVLERTEAFAECNGYWYLRADYQAVRSDADAPGGIGDAGSIMTSLARVPRGERIAYHALSELMSPVVGNAALAYENYVRTIVFLISMIAEVMSERAPDGILHIQDEEIALRLDDRWLFGGVWRAERLDPDSTCSLVGFDPLITVGLGASGELDDIHEPLPANPDETGEETSEVEVPEPSPEREPEPDALTLAAEPEPVVEVEGVGQPVHWSTALRPTHRVEQRLWVKPEAELVPGSDGTITLRIEHQGDITAVERVQHVSLSADGVWLSPVQFPFDFFDGIRLTCLARQGGSVVSAATEPLAEPEELGGRVFLFEFDRWIIDPNRAQRRPPQLVDQAIRVIDRHGEDMRGGIRRLLADDIAELIFGPWCGAAGTEVVTEALEGSPQRVTPDAEGWWYHRRERPGAGRGTGRFEGHAPDAGIFSGASERLRENYEARHRRRHRVVLHLRRLSVAEDALPERKEAYRRLRPQAPNRASLPPELPPGHTFVMGHERGRKR
jgi:hypothetical protein